jgi:7-cyano-7-deazaguanine synthase
VARKAVVLLSGGLDSSTALAIALDEGYEAHALTFDYGQRHRRETRAARAVAKHFRVASHKVLRLQLDQVGGSALTSRGTPVPLDRPLEEIGRGIPPTYVPARNTIFLSYALAWAEVVGADAIYIAANYIDYSGYPDCRPEYFQAFQRMANLATKRGVEGNPVEIRTPLIHMTKAQIVLKGKALGVPFEKTWSCYLGGERACGRCDACVLRLRGFREAGLEDPLPYEREAPAA